MKDAYLIRVLSIEGLAAYYTDGWKLSLRFKNGTLFYVDHVDVASKLIRLVNKKTIAFNDQRVESWFARKSREELNEITFESLERNLPEWQRNDT